MSLQGTRNATWQSNNLKLKRVMDCFALLAMTVLTLLIIGTSSAQAWFNGDWAYRHKITLLNSQINGNQTDFPIYLDLQHLPAQFFNNIDANGADIRMTANDGITEIPYELVSINKNTRRGELWFKAPFISSTNNLDFFIYYGNANGNAYNDFDAYGAQSVWDNGFKLVSHFNQNPSVPINDSTFFNNNILSNGSMTATNLVSLNNIDLGLNFDGTDDELDINRQSSSQRELQPHRAYKFDSINDTIRVPHNSSFNFSTNSFTITAWVYRKGAEINWKTVVGKGNSGSNNNFRCFINPFGNPHLFYGNDATGSYPITALTIPQNKWTFVTWGLNAQSNQVFYKVNDQYQTISTTVQSVGNLLDLFISGDGINPTYIFNGGIFDLRIYNGALSQNELDSIYNFRNINRQALFWLKGDDTHSTIAFDSSGNNNHGTKTNITPSTFHYEGNDVPYSFQNSVGYSLATNLVTHANRIGYDAPTGRDWNRSANITMNLNNDIAPDGSNNATRINSIIAGNSFISQDNIPIKSGTNYTASFYAKAGSNSSVRYEIGSGPNNTIANFNLVSQGVTLLTDSGNIDAIAANIESVGNGWFRCSTQFRTLASWTGGTNFALYSGSVIGSNHLLWGAQLEQGTNLSNIQITNGNIYAINFIPKDESKPNQNKDIFNGDLSYSGLAPDYTIYNGSFAGSFDGVDDYISLGTLGFAAASQSQTITAWAKAKAGGNQSIVSENLSNYSQGPFLDLMTASNRFKIGFWNGSNWQEGLSASTFADNDLHHLVAIRDDLNQQYKLWVDGSLELVINDNSALAYDNTAEWFIGATYRPTAFVSAQNYNGSIAGVQIWEYAFSDEEAINAYKNPYSLVGPAASIKGFYPISDGGGISIHDVSGNNNHGTLTDAENGELFWNGATQDRFHYNATKGFTKFLSTSANYPSGIYYAGHGYPYENLIEVDADFIVRNFGQTTLFNFSGISPIRIFVSAGILYVQRYVPPASYPVTSLAVPITTNQYYSLRFSVDRSAGTVAVRDLLNGNVLNTVNGLSFTSFIGTDLYIGRYENSSAGQGDGYFRRFRLMSNGLTLSEWSADSNFLDTVGSVNPTNITDDAHIIYMPALANGNGLTDQTINGLGITNPSGAFDNKAESNIFIPKSIFNLSNGDLLNIQTIFKSSNTGLETLLRKGNDNHGYELRLNNGIIEFEAMNQNGNFIVTGGTGFNNNQEHLVHILFDPDSKIEIFVDGQKENETLISNPEKFINSYNVMIANPNTSSAFFSGQSDELRFSNRNINANWVQTEYNNIFNTLNFYLIDNGTPMNSQSKNSMFWGGQ